MPVTLKRKPQSPLTTIRLVSGQGSPPSGSDPMMLVIEVEGEIYGLETTLQYWQQLLLQPDPIPVKVIDAPEKIPAYPAKASAEELPSSLHDFDPNDGPRAA